MKVYISDSSRSGADFSKSSFHNCHFGSGRLHSLICLVFGIRSNKRDRLDNIFAIPSPKPPVGRHTRNKSPSKELVLNSHNVDLISY